MSKVSRNLGAVLLGMLVVGCGDSENETREAEIEALAERHGVNVDVTLDAEGNVDSVTTNSGHARVGNNLSLPDGFPDDVPIADSWNVMSVSQVPQGGYMLQAMGDATQEAVVADLRAAMEGEGWSEKGFTQPAVHMSQLAFEKDDRMANVNIMQMGEAQLTIQLLTMDKPSQS